MAANPDTSPSPQGRGAVVSLTLSVVAIILALAALAASLAIPGPAGPAGANGTDGATGPRGPTGNGTLQAYVWDNTSTAILVGSCTPMAGSNVTMAVPGRGTVILSASVTLSVVHGGSATNLVDLYGGTPAAYCAAYRGSVSVSGSPGGTFVEPVPLIMNYTIVAAGTYTFAIAGIASTGTTASFLSASLSAVFYPG